MSYEVKKLFDAAAGATQYVPDSSGLILGNYADAGLTVIHPAATTTTYTLQVSNMTTTEITASEDDWCDYVAIGAKSSAEKFPVDLDDPPFARVRLKMVTSAGTGTIEVRSCVKG
jgi:hypothetical protein